MTFPKTPEFGYYVDMTKKPKSQNKMLDGETVEKMNEKPEAVEKTVDVSVKKKYSFSDGTVVEAEDLGEAQKKHQTIIKKSLKDNQ